MIGRSGSSAASAGRFASHAFRSASLRYMMPRYSPLESPGRAISIPFAALQSYAAAGVQDKMGSGRSLAGCRDRHIDRMACRARDGGTTIEQAEAGDHFPASRIVFEARKDQECLPHKY